MKKALFLLLFLQFLWLYPTFVLAAESDLKTVRVGVYDNSPKIYRDGQGNIKGFWADIVNYIAKKENWNLTYVFGTWEQGLERLEKGEIDLMVDVAISKEREQKYDFNDETTLIAWGIFYTRKGVEFNSFMDLQNKNIAIMESGILYAGSGGLRDILSSFGIRADIVNVKVYEDVFKLLDNGQADVGVVNWFFGIANEDKYKVHRTGIIFQPTDLKFALVKNSPKNSYLKSVLDYHLRAIKRDEDSIYYQSINKNFGIYLEKVEVTPKWLKPLLMSSGLLLALIGIGFLFMKVYQERLKREVERKTFELKESEKKYRDLVENVPDITWTLNDKGEVTFISSNVKQILGYSPEDFYKNSKFLTENINPEDIKKVTEAYSALFKKNKKLDVEYRLKTKEGQWIWIHARATNVYEKNGRKYTNGIFTVITERKIAEERIKELDNLKSKFIQIVSHQLRTPLGAIRWNIESLLAGTRFKIDEAAKESMRVSLDANIEVLSRIDDLLTALDIEEGHLAYLDKKSLSLESLWESVMTNAKKRCAVKNINFLYQPPSKPLSLIEVDHNKIRTVLEKIIDNSIFYTEKNGKITVSLKQIKNKIRFEVTDSGIGIPKAEQKNIFLRFYRATNAISMRPDASGLGLFIAKYFATQHGGEIGFESEEGKGSTFWFELPVAG